eukprot:7065425-Karenia_brevis.AAC.1
MSTGRYSYVINRAAKACDPWSEEQSWECFCSELRINGKLQISTTPLKGKRRDLQAAYAAWRQS